jgi:hypothetical protein
MPKLLRWFASGSEIDPTKIKLTLRRVRSDTLEADLFRLATLTWSVPVSAGFGRRMRYLVWDEGHDRLAGIIALGDPVFNLSVRDKLIGWSTDDRSERLVNLLDAYVLGAVPPYSCSAAKRWRRWCARGTSYGISTKLMAKKLASFRVLQSTRTCSSSPRRRRWAARRSTIAYG